MLWVSEPWLSALTELSGAEGREERSREVPGWWSWGQPLWGLGTCVATRNRKWKGFQVNPLTSVTYSEAISRHEFESASSCSSIPRKHLNQGHQVPCSFPSFSEVFTWISLYNTAMDGEGLRAVILGGWQKWVSEKTRGHIRFSGERVWFENLLNNNYHYFIYGKQKWNLLLS